MRNVSRICMVACLLATLASTCTLAASAPAGSELTAKAFDPNLARNPYAELKAFGLNFDVPAEGNGTVHKKAIIIRLRGRIPLKAAIDSSKADTAAPDVLRLDFTGKGQFANTPTVPVKLTRYEKALIITFGPHDIVATIAGKNVPLTIRGEYTRFGNGDRTMTVMLGTSLVGKAKFGDVAREVTIVDYDGNMVCGDMIKPVLPASSPPMSQGDMVIVGKVRSNYGQPILVDGAWYNVKLTLDRKRLTVTKSDAKTAMVKVLSVGAKSCSVFLVGKKYIMRLSPESGKPMAVPADEYRIKRVEGVYLIGGKAGGQTTKLMAYGGDPATHAYPKINVPAGKTTELRVGLPLKVRIDASVSGRTVTMKYRTMDASGLKLHHLQGGVNLRPLLVAKIHDDSGNLVYTAKFEYS